MVRRLSIACLGLVLADRQSIRAEDVEVRRSTELTAAYAGKPLSAFMLANGATPTEAFDMPGGARVFVFTQPCFSWWHIQKARPDISTPVDFTVTKVDARSLSC